MKDEVFTYLIVGCGDVWTRLIESFLRHGKGKDIRLAFVGRQSDESTAKEFNDKLGSEVATFLELDQDNFLPISKIRNWCTSPDQAWILSPDKAHAPQLLELARKFPSMELICEKPICTNLEEATALKELVQAEIKKENSND